GIWAANNKVACCTFHANWHKQGTAAELDRSAEALYFIQRDCVMEFIVGHVTADMIKQATNAVMKDREVASWTKKRKSKTPYYLPCPMLAALFFVTRLPAHGLERSCIVIQVK